MRMSLPHEIVDSMSEPTKPSEFFTCWKCAKVRHVTWKILMQHSPPICSMCMAVRP